MWIILLRREGYLCALQQRATPSSASTTRGFTMYIRLVNRSFPLASSFAAAI
jgi:hypothetical protein